MRQIPIRPSLPAASPRRVPASAPPWRLAWLFAAPHRLAFAAAALVLATSALWWALAMLARWAGWAWPWNLPPAHAHALLMGFGFMPLFFAGFLFTAGPKWLGMPPVAALALWGPVRAVLAGWGVFLLGVHAPTPGVAPLLAALGLAAVAGGWSVLAWRFVGLVRASPVPDRVHATCIASAAAFGALLLWAAAGAVLAGEPAALRPLALAGLWGFVGVVYATVAHRMIPFFTAAALPALDAWRPQWLLVVFVASMAMQAVFAALEALAWPLPAWGWGAMAALEAPIAMLLLALALRWGLVQSLKHRLLAMLHLGFVWLGIAFALSALSHALLAATGGQLSLGLAPLHAYTMGFLGSILVAMATRVSCGHSGRALAADDLVWGAFLVLQVAVVLRLVAALWPAAAAPMTAVAALAWAVVMVGWALRYGRWYGQPRVDGRPG
ncbi:MAG: NnrS family protein [Burkholderiaceae bacterium]|jgi:uncharacterized protein involved in response to NO|nr:NnrS family protein [Burkholderiaceae bacterium]